MAVASATSAARPAQPPTSMAERTARERCGVSLWSARIVMGTAPSSARNWKVSLSSSSFFFAFSRECLLLRRAHTERLRAPLDRLFRRRRELLRSVQCRAKLSLALRQAVPSAAPRLDLQQSQHHLALLPRPIAELPTAAQKRCSSFRAQTCPASARRVSCNPQT